MILSWRSLIAFASITLGYGAAYMLVGGNINHQNLVLRAMGAHLTSSGLGLLQ